MPRRPPMDPPRPQNPGAVDDALDGVEKALTRLKYVYTSQAEHKWEAYARQLRSRVQNQRTELRRLNVHMRSLRADAHEAEEKLTNANMQVGLYVSEVDAETTARVQQAYRRMQAEARRSRSSRETNLPKENPNG